MTRSLRLVVVVLVIAALIGGAYTGYCRYRDRTPEAARGDDRGSEAL